MPPLFALWLALAPPDTDYDSARTQLAAALDGIGQVSTEDSIAALDRSLAALINHPIDLAADLDALAELDHARISLVWLHLAEGDTDAATTAMDAAVRSARGHLRSASSFGPMVRELYEERVVALGEQGTAIIEVDCRVPCQVIIDEHRSANPTEPLYLGHHRVWVSARANSFDLQFFDIALETPGTSQLLVYPVQAEPPLPSVDASPSSRKRLLPRWAEILGLSLGAGVVLGGTILLAIDERCGNPACDFRWENTARGATVVGLGSGIMVAFGVLMAVDEVRVRGTRTKQVALTWTMRF